jgi:hypothetical protein
VNELSSLDLLRLDNAEQVIYTAMENLRGRERLRTRGQEAAVLINYHGNAHAGALLSALHQLEDPKATR